MKSLSRSCCHYAPRIVVRLVVPILLLVLLSSPSPTSVLLPTTILFVEGSIGPINTIRRPWMLPISNSNPNSIIHRGGHGSSTTTSSTGTRDIINNQLRALRTIQNTPRAGAAAAGGSFFPKDANELYQRYDSNSIDLLVGIMNGITQTLILCGKTVIPPTVSIVSGVVSFYRNLPTDLIIAQIGLVYCFAGGYYPTLFSSIQAAKHCGWDTMISSIQDLTSEAIKVIDASTQEDILHEYSTMNKRQVLFKQTDLILKTMDPMKINQAVGSLYTTWLGVSVVLEKEYARVISLSMTLAYYCERVTSIILGPPIKFVVSEDYHKWIPVMIGWTCKAIAMNVAWRIQRILTASTSAMTGGVMFSRSILRIIRRQRRHNRRNRTRFGRKKSQNKWYDDDGYDEEDSTTPTSAMLEDIIGFIVAGIGFWTQIQSQYKNNFSFEVPFPINLITWPFDLAEKWIQWQITK